ncbi:MAG: ABC transporter ATP-binding protein/permease [Oscillospiraceae bacterium]|jgi:ATP-binding cassette subfamily B protein|nr:ABC transporter ATP-binding protein/permease [Oscillospiraceae bacterium]
MDERKGGSMAQMNTKSAAPAKTIAKAESPVNSGKYGRVCFRLLALAKPLFGYLVLAAILGTVDSLSTAFIAVFGTEAALHVAGDSPMGLSVHGALIAAAVCALLRGGLRYGEQYLNHFVAFRLLALIRSKAFGALRRLAPAKLEERGKGGLITLMTADTELLEIFFAHTLSPVMIAVMSGAVFVIFLWGLHPLFAVALLSSYLVIGGALPLLSRRLTRESGEKIRDEAAALDSFVLDDLRGLDETIRFGASESRIDELRGRSAALSDKKGRLRDAEGLFGGVSGVLMIFFTAITPMLGYHLSARGEVGLPETVIATVVMAGSFGPALALSALPASLAHTFAAARRMFALTDESPAVDEVSEGRAPAFDGMRMKKVRFAYSSAGVKASGAGANGGADRSGGVPDSGKHEAGAVRLGDAPGDDVLNGFSMDIPVRGITGLMGKSGSGKSTALKLLMRFWDAGGGLVEMSGADVREIDTAHLRKTQSYMTQETALFSGSLRENLLIARPGATRAEIDAACRKASVTGFISGLPDGLDTSAGELGNKLSEGEKQRIGLARAFLHDSPLILLDEPTSRLDSLNEAVILKALYECSDDRSVVIVSHRRSAMRAADKVISIAGGKAL